LIIVAVGDGVGVGVGVGDGDGDGDGEGVGVGVGEAVAVGVGDGDADCACAEETQMASTKTMATSRANARSAPILSARDAQRMNFIPDQKRPLEKLREKPAHKPPICAQFMRSVNRLRPSPRTEQRPLLFGSHRRRVPPLIYPAPG
jgi:hypothetical protein